MPRMCCSFFEDLLNRNGVFNDNRFFLIDQLELFFVSIDSAEPRRLILIFGLGFGVKWVLEEACDVFVKANHANSTQPVTVRDIR